LLVVEQERGDPEAITGRMESVSTLASGVAHQINNPLAFIAANLEMVVDELKAPAGEARLTEVMSMLEEARVGVERIKNIVKGLMTFSRSDEDRRTPLDVERILDIAIDMAEVGRHARVIRDFSPLPTVDANEARLCQVFINLLSNAVEALPPDDPIRHEVTITTHTDRAGAAVIEVRDLGSGIAADVRPRIFDPFFTTRTVGEGIGLGLSICHNIIRQLGGEISFETEVDVGSTFRVVLPAAQRPVTKADSPHVANERRGRVLIVDDEVIFASSLRRLLSRDHVVTVVNSANSALELVRAGEQFDVILCDLMMPGITGMELHTAMKKLSPAVANQMVFLTGGAFTPESQKFLEEHPNDWLEKPCDLEELRAKVRSHIE
jgi:CheY-like chemotaxis protein/two-component sensor histidine kinase